MALCLLAAARLSQAQNYTVTDLGTLAGDSKSVACGASRSCNPNSTGQAAGTSSNPSAAIATLFSHGKTTNLNTLNANVSVAMAINDAAEVVGYDFFYSDPSGAAHAFLFSNGSMTDIHSPSLFPAGTQAYAINNSGEVVGQGHVTSSTFHAFIFSGGRMVDIGTLPGGSQATAYGINDAGQVTGTSETTNGGSAAFLYSNGKMVSLGFPAGSTATDAHAINGSGQIVGSILFSGAPSHAALYSGGAWTDLGVFPGTAGTFATGINIGGEIVGTAIFPVTCYCHPPKPPKHVGFVVQNGALVDLNKLIPGNSGFVITDALGINDSGQILCNATNAQGQEHAVLLSPK